MLSAPSINLSASFENVVQAELAKKSNMLSMVLKNCHLI